MAVQVWTAGIDVGVRYEIYSLMGELANQGIGILVISSDFPELLGALAPRACFISAPLGDTNFKWRSVDNIVQAASQVYRLYGVPQNLRVEHPDCGHLFPKEMRGIAYQLFDQNLR